MTETKGTTKRRVTKLDTSKPALVIEDGEVITKPLPEIAEEVIEVVEEEDNGKPKYRINTPNGEAVYEYSGDCWDCANEKTTVPVFHCITHPIRADAELGNQLAAFWNDGGSIPLCQKHYTIRLGGLPKQEAPVYKVIEKSW